MIRIDYDNGDIVLLNSKNIFVVHYRAANDETEIVSTNPGVSIVTKGNHINEFDDYPLDPETHSSPNNLMSPITNKEV